MATKNKKLENQMINAFNSLDKSREVAKVVVSQSTQIPDSNVSNPMLRSSLETIDTIDLSKFFIINRSANMKQNLAFTMRVLKTNIDECNKLKNNPHCKDIAQYSAKVNTDTYKNLLQLYKLID